MGGKRSNCGIGEERYGIVGEKSEENRRGKGKNTEGIKMKVIKGKKDPGKGEGILRKDREERGSRGRG